METREWYFHLKLDHYLQTNDLMEAHILAMNDTDSIWKQYLEFEPSYGFYYW